MAKRFGLEVEFVGDLGAAIRSLEVEGLAVNDGRHSHMGFSETAWTVKRDGSVYGGGELVSPPLDFDNTEERAQVTRAITALQRSGARPDPTAGIHVHVEAKHTDGRDMTAREIASVVRFTYKFEDALYRIASSGWQTIRGGAMTYARPIPEGTAQAIMKVQTQDELRNVWSGYTTRSRRRLGVHVLRELNRYTATNLQSLERHGTIEFRYFNSSVNPVRIQTYIALCVAIMDDARNGFSRSVKKSYRMGDMAAGRVTEKALMLRLQQILRSNSKDTKVCMGDEDWKNLRKLCWNDSRPQQNLWGRTAA